LQEQNYQSHGLAVSRIITKYLGEVMRTILTALIILIVYAGMMTGGCSRRPDLNASTHDDTLITRTGRYRLSSGGCIEAYIVPNKIIEFKLVDAQGVTELKSAEGASALHRWTLYWEAKTNRLWFQSSDMGTTVWSKDSNGDYAMEWVGNRLKIVSEMPEVFFNILSSGTQRDWAPLRKPAP
jgi:hypothetical protein